MIDLDTVMPGSILYDFGDMVRSSTLTSSEDESDLSKIQFNLSHFTRLVHGYLDAAGEFLTANEINHLRNAGLVITYEQAVRFLGDYLQGDKYYKISYPTHNLIRARTQIKLISEMEIQQEKIIQTIHNRLR